MRKSNQAEIMKKGTFITFEGGEGTGKSTSIRFAVNYLRRRGKKVLLVRDPGSTKIGEDIRHILLDPQNKKMSLRTELFLYLAARAQMTDEIIRPALDKGMVVISDRFEDSTVVYQGYAGGWRLAELLKLVPFARGNVKPALTFLLDIDVRSGLKRAGRKDRMEHKPIAFHEKIRRGYRSLAKLEPKRFAVISTQASKQEVKKRIESILAHAFK